jgi:hypothetical protein
MTESDYYDWADDARKCYDLAISTLRRRVAHEKAVREGVTAPDTDQEWRWYGEGPCGYDDLETVKQMRRKKR